MGLVQEAKGREKRAGFKKGKINKKEKRAKVRAKFKEYFFTLSMKIYLAKSVFFFLF